MEVEILQENLLSGVAAVSRFVANKASLPVLTMMKIKADKGGLVLTGTNMDTGVEKKVRAKVSKEGEAVVPAKLIHEYVNSLPPGKMELKTEGKSLVVGAARFRAKIEGVEVSEFPELPKFSKADGFEILAQDISKIVRVVSFAAMNEPSRPVLSAVMLKVAKSGKVEAVATDGYRLSLLTGVKVKASKDLGEVLVLAQVLREVERLVVEEGLEKVLVALDGDKRSLRFDFGSVSLVTRLVEGEFPNYKKILPEEGGLVVRVGKDELMEGVKTASVFARESSNIIKWSVKEGVLKLTSNSSRVGEQECEVEIKRIKGETGSIAFNGKFLTEFLGSVTQGEVEFSMGGALQPGLFKSGDSGFLHVIMPVRVQGEEESG